jgi:hypothetical protein
MKMPFAAFIETTRATEFKDGFKVYIIWKVDDIGDE